MKDPPPPKRKGVDHAATRPTPETDLFLYAKRKQSRDKYRLGTNRVNPESASADARASERGTADPDQLTEAETRFLELCLERTGEVIPEEEHAKRVRCQELLVEQSHRIAEALESQGIKAFGSAKLTLVGICSGDTRELPDFRNVVFIPAIAQRKRREHLQHLEYFLQKHPYSRMWVFTSGDRVELSGVRERIQKLHRRLSKLNAESFMKSAGASIAFRSTELGDIERNEKGATTFHVHAHTIIHLARKLTKEDWSNLLKGVRSWWKFHFKDSQRIHQARETCKYVVKPGDLEKLTAKELAELYHQTFRLHLVQSLGPLKEQRKFIEENGKKLVRGSRGQSARWEIVDSWEPRKPKRQEEENAAEQDRPDLEDWILCTRPPSFALSNKAEPFAVVLNHNGKRLEKNRKIRAIRERCSPAFDDLNDISSDQ